MRASRLLTILILLQLRGRVSAASLARELEVSVRTIYRDIDQLGAAGVPVYAERGRAGGFALLGDFRTNLTGLTPPETEAVSLIGLAQAASDLGLGEAATSARRKVLASVAAGGTGLAHRVATRVHVDPTPWYAGSTPPPLLGELAQAVWAGRQIRVTYESWKETAARTLSPLGLVMKGGRWYLAGASRATVRIYRVAAIRELTLTDEAVRRPPAFDLARFWSEASTAFERTLRSERALVRLSPLGRQLLRDWNLGAAVVVDAQPRPAAADGWIEAEIPIEPLPHAAREILRLGAEIEVLAPAGLRAAVAREALRIARLHDTIPAATRDVSPTT